MSEVFGVRREHVASLQGPAKIVCLRQFESRILPSAEYYLTTKHCALVFLDEADKSR